MDTEIRRLAELILDNWVILDMTGLPAADRAELSALEYKIRKRNARPVSVPRGSKQAAS